MLRGAVLLQVKWELSVTALGCTLYGDALRSGCVVGLNSTSTAAHTHPGERVLLSACNGRNVKEVQQEGREPAG